MSHSTIKVTCTHCRHPMTVAIAELLPGSSQRCVECGRTVEFTAHDIDRGVRQAHDDMIGDSSESGPTSEGGPT